MAKKRTAQERFNLELKQLLVGVQAEAYEGPLGITTCYVSTELIENAVRALTELETSEKQSE